MSLKRSIRSCIVLVCVCLVDGFAHAESPKLELKKGDHIAIIGNTLADRMQHYGWVETMLYARHPQHELVIRNLGFSADSLKTRPRSDNFGTPDEWLTKVQANIIVAFFGYNEAFAGDSGVEEFQNDLGAFVDHTLSQKYDGRTAPTLVLCSPICHENIGSRHLPDGSENNVRLRTYTDIMQKVALQKNVLFVDLFTTTQRLYEQSNDPLTINGIHLNDAGYRGLSGILESAFFGENTFQPDASDSLRKAVLVKNNIWHNIYRATDGYSVFGGRSGLKFVEGQTNFEVQQRELEILTVMTANRDKVIWAAANKKAVSVDDSNLPAPIPVVTNKPGTGEGGKHAILGGEEAIQMMTVHHGMEVNLFASEETFPELVNPVQSAVDADGRLWVAAWPTYPHWNPLEEMNDKLLIFADDDSDGKADRCITFADGLHNPTGFEFWNSGVLVAMAPDIFFLKDTDGDDRADIKERIFHGIDSADTHHTANSFVMDPAGRFYFSRGIFHYENFETPTRTYRAPSGPCGVFRWDPLTWEINHHFQIGPNPHGNCIDQWGNQFVTDGTGGTGNYVGFPGQGAPKQLYEKRVRPVPATCILDSDHFPPENRGNLLIANVIGFQGVTQYHFEQQGASLHAAEVEPIVYSTDPNFRPSDMEIGGDGALYILDWQNPIIGHMQHNLRDPSRDHQHGRVYRVTATGHKTMPVAKMKGRPIAEVVNVLGSSTLSERYRARLELTGRDSREAVAAATQWAEQFDASQPADALKLTEALWVHQQHRIPNLTLLTRVLGSPVADARAAAVKVLAEWTNDREGELPESETVSLLIDLASDSDARVRAQAVVAAAGLKDPAAAEVIFAARQQPMDLQLEFNIKEAIRLMDVGGYLRRQLTSGQKLSAPAQAYALANASVDDLLKMEKSEGVYQAILTRENAPVEALKESLAGLAKLRKKPQIEELFNLIEGLTEKADANVLNSLARLLSSQPPDQLRSVRDRIAALASNGHSEEARRVALASWITADGDADAVFAAAEKQSVPVEELLKSLSLVNGESARSSALEKVLALVPELPGTQGSTQLTAAGLVVDYYFRNPPNVAIETLEKKKPKATGRASTITIDVPVLQQRDQFALRFTGHLKVEKAGEYTLFIKSDDGSRFYLDGQLLINNDGLHGMDERSARASLTAGLHPIVVTYFDNGGGDGLEASWSGPGIDKQSIPAEALVTAAAETPQQLGITAMMGLPGNEGVKAAVLTGLLRKRQSSNLAMTSIDRIPATSWPEDQLGSLSEGVLSYLASLDPQDRNSADATVALKIGESLKGRLAGNEQRRFRGRLDQIVVPLISIGTVEERMIYDVDTIAVKAGRPVQFALSNSDRMPHNFAIVSPGFLQEVGELAEATGRDQDAAARSFIPKSDRILAASRLIQPGQKDAVYFEVPDEPGIYPYVCTYPGHWRRMYGAMYVVANLQEYQADPAAYVTAHKLEMKDELLQYLSRNTDWKLADLAADAAQLTHRGNNFAVGEQLFRVASCVGCHKLNGKGTDLGPDLTKLNPEYKTVDVLEHILDPSKKIDKKYQSSTLVLKSGKVLTGLVVKENDEVVDLLDNPVAPDRIQKIRKSDIDERELSSVSIMPKGVMNKLIKDEILDLLAYVVAGGNSKSDLYADHKHAH